MPIKVRFYSFWSSDDERKLLDMRTNGMAYEAIGYALGRSGSSVNHKWLELQRRSRIRIRLNWRMVAFLAFASACLYLAATTPTA